MFVSAATNFIRSYDPNEHQYVEQFIRACRFGPCFRLNLIDRGGVENTEAIAAVSVRSAPRVNRLSPAFFQRRVVEKCVRPRIQDFGRKRRWLRQIACNASDLVAL